MRAIITYKNGTKDEPKRLTEIHYCYPSHLGKRIAFESNIKQTGFTIKLSDIKEIGIFDK